MKIIRKVFGGFCILEACGGVIAAIAVPEPGLLSITVVFGLLAWLCFRKPKSKGLPNQEQQVRSAQREKTVEPRDTVPLAPCAPEVVEPVDAYIEADGMVYRTDGQPISDREVPYLIEMGWRNLINTPGGVPADATPEERYFLECLEKALVAAGKSPYFRVHRMSTKALSVNSEKAYLWKIKLQGKTTWMQYLTGPYNAETAENRQLNEYVQLIKFWVRVA